MKLHGKGYSNKATNIIKDLIARDVFSEQRRLMDECRFRGSAGGHYESYFLRANHPSKPIAFWIRFTLFSPKGNSEGNEAELWAIVFDGESEAHTAVKESSPLIYCHFDPHHLNVRIGQSILRVGESIGQVKSQGQIVSWELTYQLGDEPVSVLPKRYLQKSYPKAKAVVANPNAMFNGRITVNGETLHIDQWQGSENHNWGSAHTDEYAWGQVAGFDNANDAFLEMITARVKVGPFFTPWVTMLVLRLDGKTYELNRLFDGLKAKGRYDFFVWRFETANDQISIKGYFSAPKSFFVGLNYRNPPGGHHHCLNTKIATCQLQVQQTGQPERCLVSNCRAAFEILTQDKQHELPIQFC